MSGRKIEFEVDAGCVVRNDNWKVVVNRYGALTEGANGLTTDQALLAIEMWNEVHVPRMPSGWLECDGSVVLLGGKIATERGTVESLRKLADWMEWRLDGS